MLHLKYGGVTMKYELVLVSEEGITKSFWYTDLDSLLFDIKYDLFDIVIKSKYCYIKRI